MLSFLWFLYPIAWGLADGGNQISPDGEMVFYGVLDLLAKPVFAVVHLWGLRNLDYDVLGLQSGKRSAYMEESGNRVNAATSGKALESGHHHEAGVGNTGAAPAVNPATHGASPSEAHTAVH